MGDAMLWTNRNANHCGCQTDWHLLAERTECLDVGYCLRRGSDAKVRTIGDYCERLRSRISTTRILVTDLERRSIAKLSFRALTRHANNPAGVAAGSTLKNHRRRQPVLPLKGDYVMVPRRAGINSGRHQQPRTPPDIPATYAARPGHVANGAAHDFPQDNDPGPADEFVGSDFQRTADKRWPRGMFVPRWAIQITRSRSELLVLAQIAYWCGWARDGKLRCKEIRDGHYWIYKTFRSLARDIAAGITRDQVRGAVRKLQARKIVVSQPDHPHHRVLYRLSRTAIQAALESAEQEEVDDEAS